MVILALVLAAMAVAVATACVMARRQPRVVARSEQSYPPPPVTMETPALSRTPSQAMVPPIDRNVLAALAASGATDVARPPRIARGSRPPSCDDVATDLDEAAATLQASDLDDAAATLRGSDLDAETLRPGQDLDDDAMTRADMQPVN